MKTKTTTREYDAEGKLVKETVVEYDEQPVKVAAVCTCRQYTSGTSTGHWCAVHGYVKPYGWYCSSGITATAGATYRINAPHAAVLTP